MFCIVGAMPHTALGASMALINFLRYQTPAKILNLNLNSARSFENTGTLLVCLQLANEWS
jgi:hypothetical protein